MSGKLAIGPFLYRAPLLRFMVIGFVLLCCRSLYTALPRPILSAVSARLPEERDSAHQDLLFRTALALGLDRQASVIRDRLVAVGQFLELGAAAPDQMIERTRALGLAESDPIVRRHMEELADLALRQGGAAVLPSEAEVEDYYAAHEEQFLDPSRVTFVHVYFSSEQRGAAAAIAAQAAMQRLRNDRLDPGGVRDWGDPFVGGSAFQAVSRADLGRVFGSEFAAAMEGLAEHNWEGPLISAYGAHVVWIERKSPAHRRPLATVRNQIVHLLTDERRQQLAASRLALLDEVLPQ